MANIRLPNSARLQNIGGFLRKYDPNAGEGLEVVFHPSWINIHPMVLASVAALGRSAVSAGHRVSFPCGIPNHASMKYIARMGLFEYLGHDIPPGLLVSKHDATGRFIPLTEIRNSVELQSFLLSVIPALHLEAEQAKYIKYVISEMVRNVLEHAYSSHGAIVCAQWYPGTKVLGVGIADSGIGIRNSLSRNHSPGSHHEAINIALKPGMSGTTSKLGGNEYNAGAGLFFTKSIAEVTGQYFLIASGDAAYKLMRSSAGRPEEGVPIARGEDLLNRDPEKSRHRWEQNLPHWPGTVIGIDISAEGGEDFNILVNELRRAYRAETDAGPKKHRRRPRFQ